MSTILKRKYTGKQVTRAGETLVDSNVSSDSDEFLEAMDVLSYWRFSHSDALDVAFAHLQETARQIDKEVFFAKRLKRHDSIVKKLQRFKSMKLRGMQDIGGCRAVLFNNKRLKKVVRELKKSPDFKSNQGKFKLKDYISKPKSDGYRSFHIIGWFPNSDGEQKNIEIQLRTRIQHYWATAVEIVDLFTDQALKSNQGDEEWKTFFRHVAIQFEVLDSIHLFGTNDDQKQFAEYQAKVGQDSSLAASCKIAKNHCTHLDVFEILQGFTGSLQVIDGELKEASEDVGYVLLIIDTNQHIVNSTYFKNADSELAERKYTEAEKAASSQSKVVVALVSTGAVGDIKEAYPNYFADSTQFLKYLNYIDSYR
jgi:ppGpp synthetase/RelA/SpoT-type nucleotidyltranferase